LVLHASSAAAIKSRGTEREEWIFSYLEAWGKFRGYDARLQSSIRFSTNETFSAFASPELASRFCLTRDDGGASVNFQDILEEGSVLVLYAPAQEMGDVAAQAAATLAKLVFMRMMLVRRQRSAWNQTRTAFLLLDEYTRSLVTSDQDESDLAFYALSRESGCVTLAATQAYSTIRASVDTDAVWHSVLQAFVGKICFKTSDPMTVKFFTDQIGKYDETKLTHSMSENEGWSGGSTGGGGNSGGSSKSVSSTTERRDLVDAQWFSKLENGCALATLTLDEAVYEDVIYCDQVRV
jgi:hypothetical protein